MIALAAFEEIIDRSRVAPRIEVVLPAGVRGRQLSVRTLLAGMCLAQADHRPAHLTRVHQALTSLPEDEQRRLGVIAEWKNGPHQLTYRQTERTAGLVVAALAKDEPDGLPSAALQTACDDLLEASIPDGFKDASSSLAVDYCPRTPRPLLELGPLARTATKEQAADWERTTSELARYKLGRLTADDADGYHRVQCPAAMSKVRCPLRPASMTLDRDRPEILQPPEHPQACCAQQTITVPPDVLAKTAQKHDYPSAPWRRSYARRTSAERGFATAKDPATNTISRGWCRLMGQTPLMLFTVTLLIVRNQHILTAWNARQEETQRRAAAGLPPRTRRRRRKTLASLTGARPP
jgi:hypothetical protein